MKKATTYACTRLKTLFAFLAISSMSLLFSDQAEVTYLDMLSDDGASCPAGIFEVTLSNQYGPLPTINILTADHIGQTITATVIDTDSGNTCWGTIIVEDKLGPTVECPTDTLITSCTSIEFLGGPVFEDACEGILEPILLNETIETLSCDPDYVKVITREYYAVDSHGRASDPCSVAYYVARIDTNNVICPPSYLAAVDSALVCTGVGWDLDGDEYPDAEPDSDGNYEVEPPTMIVEVEPGVFDTVHLVLPEIYCVRKIMRIWSIREWHCGDEIEMNCIQMIEIADTLGPVITCPSDMIVSTNITMAPTENVYHGTIDCGAELAIPLPPASDDCGAITYDITYPGGFIKDYNGTDLIELPMGENIVKYTVYDECYNSNDVVCEFTVNVVDKTPPVTICDQYTVVGLTTGGPDSHTPVHASSFDDGSYDDCKLKKVLARRMDPSNCDCQYPIFPDANYLGEYNGHHYYISTKPMPCYNAHGLATAMGGNVVIIDDNGEKDWITDAVQGSSIDSFYVSGGPYGYDQCAIMDKDGNLYDDSGVDANYIFELADPCGFSSYVNFCCADLGTDQMVVFRAIDAYGNYNDCMVTVEVQDKVVPVIVCPSDTTIFCTQAFDLYNMEPAFGTPIIAQSCSDHMAEFSTEDLNQCNVGTIIRTFYIDLDGSGAMDNGENPSCHQYIYVNNPDEFTEDMIDWPDCDIDVDGCADPNLYGPDVTGWPTFNGNECDLVGANYEDEIFNFNNSEGIACAKILRRWVVIDWCQPLTTPDMGGYYYKNWVKMQVIKISNFVEPVIVGCEDIVVESFDADCGPALVNPMAEASDDCTLELGWTADIYMNEDHDPSSPFATIDSTHTGIGPMTTDGTTKVTLPGLYPVGTHYVVWWFTDRCGNITACTQKIDVVSRKAPTPYCINGLAVDLMPMDTDNDGIFDDGMVELWASDFDQGSYHNCYSDVHLSFSEDIDSTNRTFTCDDLLGQTSRDVFVTIYATVVAPDGALVQSYCETYVNLQDNNNACGFGNGGPVQTRISGTVSTEIAEMIEDVRVELVGSNAPAEMTDDTGDYAFPDMPSGGDYTINPTKDDDHLNGVSTLDLVLIQRHILGLQALNSPYKIVAADINKDRNVTSVDLIELRKLILGIYTTFPDNNSWRFIDSDYAFIDPINPLLEQFEEAYNIFGLSSDMLIDFVGLKVGDVNNSATTNYLNSNTVDNRNSDEFVLEAGMFDQDRNTVNIPIYAQNDTELYGMQFTLNIKENVDFQRITSGQLTLNANNYAQFNNDNLISFSWSNSTGQQITSTEPLFYVEMTKETLGKITFPMLINSDITMAEAYTDLGTIQTPNLIYRSSQGNEITFELFQNVPNPFSNLTEISFILPSSGTASLTITDVAGKVVKIINGDYPKGLNTIELSRDDLQTNGFLYYTLKTENDKATMKMVLVK